MILMSIAAFAAAATADLAAGSQREALSACLKEAIFKAKTDKVAADGFEAFARAHCATYEADLRKAVIALDIKNGISRKDAAANATLELNDYFLSAADRYSTESGILLRAEAKKAAAATPASAPAAPAQPSQP
jgi:hypothetical protein